MLYLDDDRRSRWPAVARTLASLFQLDMVLCLYPDSEHLSDPFVACEDDEPLERITTYLDGDIPPRSARVAVDEALMTYLESHVDEFEEWGDSLILYRPGATALVAAAIPHEGIILVADEFGAPLDAAGFRVSSEPPEGW